MIRITDLTGKFVSLRLVSIVLIGIFWVSAAGNAGLSAEHKPVDVDRREIARIEAYLNTIRSIEAGFLQISSGGQVAEGRLYLQRPQQLRLDYRPPASVQIYADGYWLAFIDTELEEISQVPLNATLAGILVRERITLSGDVTVTRIEKRVDQVRVHLVQTKEPDGGKLVLSFGERPLRLQNWTVTDALGVRTRISLINAKFNHRIDKKIFQYDPDLFENDILQ